MRGLRVAVAIDWQQGGLPFFSSAHGVPNEPYSIDPFVCSTPPRTPRADGSRKLPGPQRNLLAVEFRKQSAGNAEIPQN